MIKKAQTPKKKISLIRGLLTGVMLVVTTLIWYEVGVVLFGFSKPRSQVSPKPVYSEEIVVAEINGQLIKLKDVRSFMNDIPQLAEVPFEMVYPQVLDTMINTRVLVSGAEASGTAKEEDVKKALKMAREQILSQAYLTKQLEAGMTPEALQALYVEAMQNYVRPAEVHARHIVVDSEKTADTIYMKLKSGADFAKLADEQSTDKHAVGGDLGYFTENMMIPEFAKVVFAMKKGDLSKPFKTPYGWHVVLVEDKRLAEPPAFEEIQESLKQAYAERNMKAVLQAEREKAKVKVYQPNL